MDNTMNMKSNGSNVWPYVIVGSAVGGALGYLFVSESGRKIRHSVTHPGDLADDLDDARHFVEQKARAVTDRVHGFISKAKYSIEEGQLAYQEAGREYRDRARQIESKNTEITSK